MWMAQSLKCLTLDFHSDHDITVREFGLRIRPCADSLDPAWDSLSLSLSTPPLLVLSLSQKKKNEKKKTHLNKLYCHRHLKSIREKS